MTNSIPKAPHLAGFRLGETHCMCVTTNLDAVTPTPTKVLIIPGTKPFFTGNEKIGRDIVSYYHLPTFLGLPSANEPPRNDDKPTTLILRDPMSTAIIGLQTDEILSFVPLTSIKDASRDELVIPAKLTPYCQGVVSAEGRKWALIHLDNIIRDPNFRAVELPVQRPQ